MNSADHYNTPSSILSMIIRFSLTRKFIIFLFLLGIIAWGIIVAPFDWDTAWLPRNPIPVDAIPDIGENQQIVFTRWTGRSPKDVEDQVTYPLTVSLLGVPGVKTVRSSSMFGFSSIYVIFHEDVEFYWSRSRILEKLNSLSAGTLPDGVVPKLGPDATALGQVFWYTLEGRDEKGNPAGGWDLEELRSIQDWYVKYQLMAVSGVSEVASVGGFVKEYQIDVDPDALGAFNIKLGDLFAAVKNSNRDVGARTIEINRVEYVIRGRGFITSLEDIEDTVIKINKGVPVYIKNIAHVTTGPALRRGALDKEGAEVVGGVVVVRYGENPLETIKNIKKKIEEISPGLPSRKLKNGTTSSVRIIPFYDRTGLIHETLTTLNRALTEEIMITLLVVLLMILHFRSALIISLMIPLAVLICFIAMKLFKVDANIVALSGIAIAIGTIVDMGIVMCENILKKLKAAGEDENRLEIVYAASCEVGSAVITAVLTTVVSFLPVFTMEAAEGKLFKPLAFTKTFTLMGAAIIAIAIIPPLAHLILETKHRGNKSRYIWAFFFLSWGGVSFYYMKWWLGVLFIFAGIYSLYEPFLTYHRKKIISQTGLVFVVIYTMVQLASHWLPLGPEKGIFVNLLFVTFFIGGLLSLFYTFMKYYEILLKTFLTYKKLFMIIPGIIVCLGLAIWMNLSKEFMPPLDEGSFLYMPTTMPHASIGEVLNILHKQDMAIKNIPEVKTAVGKLGRAETPLDPAPVSMIETVINYRTEYILDESDQRMTFNFSKNDIDFFRDINGNPVNAPDKKPYNVKGKFLRDNENRLVPDKDGKPFRLWRPPLLPELNPGRKKWEGINHSADIWDEILAAAMVPGTTSAPNLQPISARLVMLQSGMRAPMGIKIKGPDIETIEAIGFEFEKLLKKVPMVKSSAVFADRIVGKPYLEIDINRKAAARYGISVKNIQDVIEVAIGGKPVTMTVEGRQRYPVRVRYMRERRDSPEAMKNIYVSSPDGKQIPLNLLSEIKYMRGPQVIKSEDTFLTGYVLFDKKKDGAETDTVQQAAEYIDEKIKSGELKIPPGVSYSFSGNYENQIRSEKRLMIVLPLALFVIFIILYLQFNSMITTAMIFAGIMVAWSGGFIMIWLYGLPWFIDFSLLGVNMRDLFQIHPINMSVAIWVGFLALFGIATDDGVIMATYLDQSFTKNHPDSIEKIRELTVQAGKRRVKPCLMTSATTILALIPILTSTGRGADIMIPMAIPSFGGMIVVMVTMFVVPVLYCSVAEMKWKYSKV